VKRLGSAVLVATAAAAALAACRQLLPLPQNRILQPRSVARVSTSTADARQYFEHDKHAPAFAAHEIQCIDCHRYDFVIDTGDPKLYQPLSAHAVIPGSAACHFCHVEGEGKLTNAPGACTTCHTNLAPLMPDDHQIAWLRVHGTQARANPTQCESCHRQSQCIDCHERRDSVQTIAHERNFRFLHGIEARTNPMQCSACHREDFCINCHLQGNVRGTP
jgi:hypothetical protein